jgi:glycosyltransferase involved in cell wall biosynthesis
MSHDVLLVEPWYRGSHRQWADGWRAASRHRIHVLAGSDERWRRGLVTAPAELAARIDRSSHPVDAVVASTPIDLAALLGLSRRRLGGVPVMLYAHETQVSYPPGPEGGRARAAMPADWTSMLCADRVMVASEHHREAVQRHLPEFVAGHHPLAPAMTQRALEVVERIEVLPVGVDLPRPASGHAEGPLRVLWNHRWAHDKAPDRFVHSLRVLAGEGHRFEVIALGEVERSGRKAHERLRRSLGDRLVQAGPVGRDHYRRWLARADIVVSTARHDFFGVAVVEATAAGARPLLPDRLSYPELIPTELADSLLYRGQLADALRPLVGLPRADLHAHRAATTDHVSRYAWDKLAPRYDELIDSLVEGQ